MYKILLVDDSPFIRTLVKNILKPIEPLYEEASNGKEALEKVFKTQFDLIITDIEMPEKDGVELCIELKAIPSISSIPIIILSAFDSEEAINKGFRAGASAYISKKEATTHLLSTVKEILIKSNMNKQQLIMIIDDSTALLELLKDGLTRNGFQIMCAENGKIALELLKDIKPNLIITDIYMPEIDGLELLNIMQTDDTLKDIPVITMSSMSDPAHIKRMIQRGAAAYIVKPFSLDELIALIEKILTDQFLLILKEKERLDLERNMLLGSITSLVSALEARDQYTKGHSESVATILSGMVKLSGGTDEEVQSAYVGGQLHDIGKIGIRDSVLLKSDKLTDEEFSSIKQHPVIGSTILKPIPSLDNTLSVVYYHHERMDGRGYPEKIKGNKIPLWARFTAVADTYDALTSDRPYRKGMDQGKALQIINDVKGSQLFPEAVELFLKYLKK